MTEKEKLTPEELDKVNGGYIVYEKKGDVRIFYVVDDKTGQILKKTLDGPEAQYYVNHYWVDGKTISPEQYKEIFGKDLH